MVKDDPGRARRQAGWGYTGGRGRRRNWRARAVLAIGAVVTAGWCAVAATAGTAVAAPAWRIAQIAGKGAVPGFLAGVTCESPTSCIAVGNEAVSPTFAPALVETMAGNRWREATLPLPTGAQRAYLLKIACPAPGDCVAVGYWTRPKGGGQLIETLSRGRWSLVQPPARPAGTLGAYLVDVTCPAPGDCLAVGDIYGGYAEGGDRPWAVRLENGRWLSAMPALSSSIPGFLSGVSCPTATDCVAVGVELTAHGTKTLVLSLSGGKWSQVPSPGTGAPFAEGLTSVACRIPQPCMAVGEMGEAAPTVLVRRAGHWVVVPGPAATVAKPSGLWGVRCTEVECLAVGAVSSVSVAEVNVTQAGAIVDPQGALIDRESAGHWAPEALPGPLPLHTGLEDVACTTGGCVAVGMTGQALSTGASNPHTLVLETAVPLRGA